MIRVAQLYCLRGKSDAVISNEYPYAAGVEAPANVNRMWASVRNCIYNCFTCGHNDFMLNPWDDRNDFALYPKRRLYFGATREALNCVTDRTISLFYAAWPSTSWRKSDQKASCAESSNASVGTRAIVTDYWRHFEMRLPWIGAALIQLFRDQCRFGYVL